MACCLTGDSKAQNRLSIMYQCQYYSYSVPCNRLVCAAQGSQIRTTFSDQSQKPLTGGSWLHIFGFWTLPFFKTTFSLGPWLRYWAKINKLFDLQSWLHFNSNSTHIIPLLFCINLES